MFPIIVDIFPKPIKIPKFVALVFEVQSAIKIENIKTVLGALLIAILIRSLMFQPFYIPSSSMEPTLLIVDRIFVSKY